jgi:hypothetical protein
MHTPATRGDSRAAGRRFAFELTVGFGVLAGIALWRNRPHSGRVLGAIGLFVLLLGLVVPGRLGRVSRAWMRLGDALSRVTSPVVFTLLYYLVITPVGLLRRTLGRSPLARSTDARTFWMPRAAPASAEEARRGMDHLF